MTWIWIVVVLLLVIGIAVGIMGVFTKTTSASRGGVEHPKGSRHRGKPPFEGIDRDP